MKNLVVILCLLLSNLVLAQAPASPKPTVQEKMKSLDWLAGKWQGDGWISYGPNQKQTFEQQENIQYKLDNTLLQIEGLGKNGNRTIHNALALVSYNTNTGKYTFSSYTAEGRQVNADATVEDEKLVWQMDAGPSRKIRYAIWLDEQNKWQETGEMSADNGQTWNKFFEMTLHKVQ